MLQISSGELWERVKHVQTLGMGLGMQELCGFLLPPIPHWPMAQSLDFMAGVQARWQLKHFEL